MTSVRTICTRALLALAAWQLAGIVPADAGALRSPSTRPLPVVFEANRGQADPDVRFLLRGSGYRLFLTSTEAILDVKKIAPVTPQPRTPTAQLVRERAQSRVLAHSVVRMRIVGADPMAAITTGEPQRLTVNYFRGKDRSKWVANVPTYDRLRYTDVYPGIDLVYYQREGKPAYDFVVKPGSDPRAITLDFAGARDVALDANGDLVIATSAGDIRQSKPVVYQDIDGVRQPVPGTFLLLGKNRVGFRVPTYLASLPLVIDPTLSDLPTGVATSFSSAVDADGNTIVVGFTESPEFPATNGTSFQHELFEGFDGFVAKTDPAGNILWTTYLGGTGADFVLNVAVDGARNAYVVGNTLSTDFPVGIAVPPSTTAFQSANGGGSDAFLSKFDTNGALLYSTYFGGDGHEAFTGVAVSSAGEVYVSGGATSDPAVFLAGATGATIRNVALGGDADAFAARFTSAFGLVYFTMFGGTGSDYADALAVDASGNVSLTGETFSVDPASPLAPCVTSPSGTNNDFTVTSNAAQPCYGGGLSDAFVVKLDPTGAVSYASYLGGSGLEIGTAVATGSILVAGFTDSPDFLIVNALQTVLTPSPISTLTVAMTPEFPALGGELRVADLSKFSNAGVWEVEGEQGTWLGKTATGLLVETRGATPTAHSVGAIIRVPYQTADAYVVHMTDPTTTSRPTILFSTYLGGSGDDYGSGVAVNSVGEIYVAGTTGSPDFPAVNSTTAASSSGTITGEIFVAKLSTATGPTPTLVYSVVPKDANGDPVQASLSLSTPIALSPSGGVVVAGTTGGLAVLVSDASFALDVKPTINPKAKGKIPVTILASGNFDVTQLDLTVPFTFGRTGTEASFLFCAKPTTKGLTCHFDAQTSRFQGDEAVAFLRAQTVSGGILNLQGPIRTVKSK